jgi:two-component system phosphate regulon response regulator PhoB
MPKLVLLVEDEDDLASSVDFNLRREGYTVRRARTGTEALEQATTEPLPDLILLDVMLPELSGTEVCRRLRSSDATERIPVIMVTARSDEVDRVVGLELGADDYVVKPFSVRELMLRVRAVMRRGLGEETEAEGAADAFGALRVDREGHRAWVGDDEVHLTALEFRLLTTLMARRGRVQTREQLLEDVWHVNPDVTSRTVDTHVRRLRMKLNAAGDYIETIRGVGYRFATENVASGQSQSHY